MLKRLLSVALSLILLTLSAVTMPVVAATSAPIDISVPLDGFSKQELETTYTKDAPYTTASGFKAPTEGTLGVTLHENDVDGDYIRVKSTSSDGATPNGGAIILDPNLNLSVDNDCNQVLTHTVTIRKAESIHVYWYMLDKDGKKTSAYPLHWWTSDVLWQGYSDHNTGIKMDVNTWYTVTLTMDLAKMKYSVVVDGGKLDNITFSKEISDNVKSAINSASKPFTGMGVGFLSFVKAPNSFDIADMSLSTSGSVAYDEKLTFENGNLKTSNTGWTSGPWKRGAAANISYWAPTAVDMGENHGKAIRLSHNAVDDQERKHFWFVHTVPAGAVASDGVFVAEGSYYEDDYSQFCIELKGTNTSTIYPLSYVSSSDWKIECLGDTKDDNDADMEMPKRMGWVRIRVICDLADDKLTLQYWQESNPSATLVTATRANALTDFSDITNLWFKVYSKDTDADSDADALQFVDDFRVYVVDSLQYTNSAPADNAQSRVALTSKPSMEFNMPLSVGSDALQEMVTLTDSKGNQIGGEASLSTTGCGIVFTPEDALSPAETYTYTIDGTLTDVFGQTLAIDKSISFSTSDYIKLKDCTFKQGGIEVSQSSELTCNSAVSATVKLAPNYGAVPVTLLLGLYDADTDVMVDAKALYISSLNDTERTLTLDKPMVAGFDYYPAVFVWSGIETAIPYMEYISLK